LLLTPAIAALPQLRSSHVAACCVHQLNTQHSTACCCFAVAALPLLYSAHATVLPALLLLLLYLHAVAVSTHITACCVK
jgi:hypothetical protein